MRRTHLRAFAASAALILGSASASGAGQSVVASVWTGQPVAVDGQRTDWQGAVLTEWKKDAVSFAFRNDGEMLYVLLVIQDPKYKSTIEQTGVTLYFNAPGAKAKDYGILFKRLRLNPEEYIAHLEKQGPVSDEDKAGIRQKAGFYLFHHQVLDRKGRPVPAAGEASARPAVFKYAPEGPAVAYEFSVPLVRGSDLVAGVASGPGGGPIAVGFEWGGETEEMRKAAAKRLREGANIANEQVGAGMSGTGSSGPGGGRSGMPSGKSGPGLKKYAFWATVKLAKNGS
jgi:hypothetical protein